MLLYPSNTCILFSISAMMDQRIQLLNQAAREVYNPTNNERQREADQTFQRLAEDFNNLGLILEFLERGEVRSCKTGFSYMNFNFAATTCWDYCFHHLEAIDGAENIDPCDRTVEVEQPTVGVLGFECGFCRSVCRYQTL